MNSLNTYCHVTEQVNAYTDDYTPPVDRVFDECSPLADIYQTLMLERKVTFQAGWNNEPTIYTAFDILLDRVNENASATDLAASIFAAALFNESKGQVATDLAQDCDFMQWVYDFFDYLQNEKPRPIGKLNLDFLSIRGEA